MTYSKKHQSVIAYLRTVESATTMEIYNNVPFGYYHNANKHMGALLATMVAQGKIQRMAPGRFALSNKLKEALQGDLFNQKTTVSTTIICKHNYVQKDALWKSCTYCGAIIPLNAS